MTQLSASLLSLGTECTCPTTSRSHLGVFQPLNPRASPLKRSAKSIQSKCSQQTQSNGQRLARLDCSGNRAAGEHNGGKESELNAVRVAVLDAQAAEDVEQTDGDAGSNGGDRASTDVACDSSAGSQSTEEKSGVCERLYDAVSRNSTELVRLAAQLARSSDGTVPCYSRGFERLCSGSCKFQGFWSFS
jgi:hypothetical protein